MQGDQFANVLEQPLTAIRIENGPAHVHEPAVLPGRFRGLSVQGSDGVVVEQGVALTRIRRVRSSR